MVSKVYAVNTRLKSTNELTDYYEPLLNELNCVYRRIWNIKTDPLFQMKYGSDANLVAHICNTYGLLKRTVNAMVRDINCLIFLRFDKNKYLFQDYIYLKHQQHF